MTYGYTIFCVVALLITFALEALLRTGLLKNRRFWITVVIVGFFQFLVDGWLTCRPIVTYEPAQFSSVRFGCSPADPWPLPGRGLGMPIEDLAFGFAMITQGLQWWVWWGRRLQPDDVDPADVPLSLRVE